MSGYRISELGKGPWRDIAIDAQERAKRLVDVHLTATDMMLIGLCDRIHELEERIKKMEEKQP